MPQGAPPASASHPLTIRSVPDLLARIAATIERHRMFAAGQHAGVAVSGGADSVCLLHALHELAPRWDLRLTVLHLDHGLRGEESRADAAFVRELAASFRLPAEIRAAAIASAGNLEQAAREARLAFFRDAMARCPLDRVATGHTRSDQAETVLFRFLRGAGTAGLAAIRPVTGDGIVRPLLEIGREEVRQFLRERGLPWREDSTNASPRFARNRLRQSLLPQLCDQWNPAIETTLAHTAEWARAEEAWWEGEIDRLTRDLVAEQEGRLVIRADALRDVPLAAARRLVRRVLGRIQGNLRGIEFEHVEAVLRLAARTAGSGRFRAGATAVRRSFDWVSFESARARPMEGYALAVSVPGMFPLPSGGFTLSMELMEPLENKANSWLSHSVYNEDVGILDWRCLSGPLQLRSWQAGDLYQPAGCAGEKKIKTLFQEARIPVWERSGWPILTDGAGIVWTRRFGPAARVATGATTGRALEIREIRNRVDGECVYRVRPVGRLREFES